MSGLTDKQQRFAAEYLIDLNATQAAIRAGYAPGSAKVAGSRLLSNDNVALAIQQGQKRVAKRLDITADRVITELARIGFADIRGVVKWASNVAVAAPDERSVDQIMEEGPELRSAITNVVELIDSDQISDDMAAAISEISQTDRGGLKVKLHDKRAALVDLGRHLGVFSDGVNVNVNVAMGLQAFYGAPPEPTRVAIESGGDDEDRPIGQ